MLSFEFHSKFHKFYKKQPQRIKRKFKIRLNMFLDDPKQPLLEDHSLKGFFKPQRSFSITGDVRVVHIYLEEDHIQLLRIGTHNQVY